MCALFWQALAVVSVVVVTIGGNKYARTDEQSITLFTIFVYLVLALSGGFATFPTRMTQNSTSPTAAASENCGDTLEELQAIREAELEYMEETGTLPEEMHL